MCSLIMIEIYSLVGTNKLKPKKREENSKEREKEKLRTPRRDERVERSSRKSRSRENNHHRKKSPGKNRSEIRRSRSRSNKKIDKSSKRSSSPKQLISLTSSPKQTRNERARRQDRVDEKIQNQESQRRSKPRQRERSPTPKKTHSSKDLEHTSRKKRSATPKRYENRSNRKRSPTPKRRSVERKRSPSSKRVSVERKKPPRSQEKRRGRSPSPRRRSFSRDRQDTRTRSKRSSSLNRRKQTRKSPVVRKKSFSRSRSPVPRKTSRYSRSPAQNFQKGSDRTRRYEKRSRSRSLSYSPARRNPEKYHDILDTRDKASEKNRKPAPVVKLHPTTSDRESSENDNREESKSIGKVEDFHPVDCYQEKELNRLEALKSELAAKAKESLEKKIISETATSSTLSILQPGKPHSNRNNTSLPQIIEPERAREMKIVAQTVAISTKEMQAAIKHGENKRKISLKPFQIKEGSSPVKSSDGVKTLALKGAKVPDKKKRESRSRSKTSQR